MSAGVVIHRRSQTAATEGAKKHTALVSEQCPFEIGLCIAKEESMAVSAVWRLINLLAFIEPKQHSKAHRRDACAPLPKSKSKLLLVSDQWLLDFKF
jgi:hypothetical protein